MTYHSMQWLLYYSVIHYLVFLSVEKKTETTFISLVSVVCVLFVCLLELKYFSCCIGSPSPIILKGDPFFINPYV